MARPPDAGADLGKWAQRQRQLHKNTFVTPGERKGFGQLSEVGRCSPGHILRRVKILVANTFV
jgi:hypothetical protein